MPINNADKKPLMKTVDELENFLLKKMSMTANYQPVIIRELLRRNGTATVDELLKSLMIEDQVLLSRFRLILMNWPKKTLTKHKIISHDRKNQQFKLLVDLRKSNQIRKLINICDTKIKSFNSPQIRREANVRFKLIERAKGRCEACGVLAHVKPLDVDHIVPQVVAERNRGIWHGKVPDRHGNMIGVDDFDNLQILCETCNRGKRDKGKFHDFRPSSESLLEAVSSIIVRAQEITENEPTKRADLLRRLKNCF